MEKSTGVEASIQVKPSYGLSDSEIAGMIRIRWPTRKATGARKLAEQRVEAARVLESLQGALATDAALLSEAESQAIAAATQALQQAVQGKIPPLSKTPSKH